MSSGTKEKNVYSMDHYTARKRNALELHMLIWINLRHMVLKQIAVK